MEQETYCEFNFRSYFQQSGLVQAVFCPYPENLNDDCHMRYELISRVYLFSKYYRCCSVC